MRRLHRGLSAKGIGPEGREGLHRGGFLRGVRFLRSRMSCVRDRHTLSDASRVSLRPLLRKPRLDHIARIR